MGEACLAGVAAAPGGAVAKRAAGGGWGLKGRQPSCTAGGQRGHHAQPERESVLHAFSSSHLPDRKSTRLNSSH